LIDHGIGGDSDYVGLLIGYPNGATYAVWFAGDEEGNFSDTPAIENVTPSKKLKLLISKQGN